MVCFRFWLSALVGEVVEKANAAAEKDDGLETGEATELANALETGEAMEMADAAETQPWHPIWKHNVFLWP
jgi:hypothetical protein